MSSLGSPEWLAEPHDPAAAALVAAGGAADGPLRIQYVVTGTAAGDVRFATVVEADGSLVETAGDIDDPDITLTLAAADALAIVRGEVSPNGSYMRGRTKVVGHTGQLLRLLSAATGPAYDSAREALDARTD